MTTDDDESFQSTEDLLAELYDITCHTRCAIYMSRGSKG